MILTTLLAAGLAQASTFEALRALVPDAPPPVHDVGHVRELPPPEDPNAPPLADLLDLKFVDPAPKLETRSRAEWQRRLKRQGGKASFALVSTLDASRELVLFVAGVGMNFQDAHTLVKLDDAYQVAIAVVDETQPIPDAGAEVADALVRLVRERGGEGRPLRVIGHSFGAPIAQFMFQRLAETGRIGEGRTFPKVLFVAIDGPWRGVDTPFITVAPGIRQVWGWLLRQLPLGRQRPTRGTLSVFNRGPEMKRLQRVELPPEVTTHFVAVKGKQGTGGLYRQYEPVASWYSFELGAGELERLWQVLRHDRGNWNDYDTWAVTGFARKQGLQNLQRALERDVDYEDLGWKLRQAALESETLVKFRPRYDAIIDQIVDSFRGHHTHFMWEDPEFLPYIRGRLASW